MESNASQVVAALRDNLRNVTLAALLPAADAEAFRPEESDADSQSLGALLKTAPVESSSLPAIGGSSAASVSSAGGETAAHIAEVTAALEAEIVGVLDDDGPPLRAALACYAAERAALRDTTLQKRSRRAARDLVQALRRSGRAAEALEAAALAGSRSESVDSLIAALSANVSLSHRKLTTTVEAESEDHDALTELAKRADALEEDRALMAAALAQQRAKRADERTSLAASRDRLVRTLAELTERAAKESAAAEAAEAAKAEVEREAHETRSAALAEGVGKAAAAETAGTNAHRDAEANLRKLRERAQAEFSETVRTSDAAYLELRAEYDGLKAQYEAETKTTLGLQRHFDKVDDNAAKAAHEDEQLGLFDQRRQKALDALGESAAVVQALARGYLVRSSSLVAWAKHWDATISPPCDKPKVRLIWKKDKDWKKKIKKWVKKTKKKFKKQKKEARHLFLLL